MTRRILFPILLLWQAAAACTAFAHQGTDTTYTFRFVPQKDMFYVPWKGNGSELERLLECIERHKTDVMSGRLPLYVDGYCDSGETEQASLATARTRSNRVKSELITRKGLHESNFITHNHASGGNLVTVRVILPRGNAPAVEAKAQARESGEEAQAGGGNGHGAGMPTHAGQATASTSQGKPHGNTARLSPASHGFSLRANLLRWASLTPCLGAEWRPAPSLGISVNGSWTSWTWDGKGRRYAQWEVMPELRCYWGKEKRGYLGAMFKAGQFNYKLSETGKQGDLMGGGLTGGYLLRLNSALSLDFSMGVGCMHADYDRYDVADGVRVRRGGGTKNHWGVNHLGISLAWDIF